MGTRSERASARGANASSLSKKRGRSTKKVATAPFLSLFLSIPMRAWEKLPLTSDCDRPPPVETRVDACRALCKVCLMSLLGMSIGVLFVVLKIVLGLEKYAH